MDTELLAFLLREPFRYVNDKQALFNEVEYCTSWIDALTDAAAKAGISRGQLCREILPFTEETDAKDQANIDLADNKTCELRRGAVRTRKFLRCKISDENDLRQAQDALTMIRAMVGAKN